ncbi:mtDNA inheritance, partitioning of the mitochondrial organelle [Exophiala xenobiotica]|uniref:MtDNA inheritance, partitioning of the mitochondrial organelle n=1 Tax=Lithohypha guttulata TaxID=1690604 RepID=A0ABR0JZ75_9EURO|nr:mtDNA inheritance, partitioning of the mitochondrial organelle [Lithohypha guttulata]KAK5310234.1 mtDNA inheritance, partitioning of the mitochondrial organelle [Exophiala xenobiotica]
MSQHPVEVILKAGPAPAASVPLPSSASRPSGQDEMPEHTATPRCQKRTDGPLTGRGRPKKTNRKRKPPASKPSNLRDSAPDMSNLASSPISKKRGTAIKAEPDQESPQKRARVEKLLPYIVGIDLGMWGFGRASAHKETAAASVSASIKWPGVNRHEFKAPSQVAFDEDNSTNPKFRNSRAPLVGFKVTDGMVSSAFFKASLDDRSNNPDFDNPILNEDIARMLVSFDTLEKDERAAQAVLEYLYKLETLNVKTNIIFLLTYPAACSPEGRQKLESIARRAGFAKRKGDKIKVLSEPHAGCISSFTDVKLQTPHDVWMVHFKEGDLVTVLDIGSLTIDTTTERVIKNDPTLQLKEEIVSAGGRCGTIALHLGILKAVIEKFDIPVSALSPQLVGRGTEFFDNCETILSSFGSSEYDDDLRLRLTLDPETEFLDYDEEAEEVILQPHELEKVIDDFLEYPKKLLMDQWETALKDKGVQVKTTTICGGGAMIPSVLAKLEDFCSKHSWKVNVFTPRDPIAAVSKGAVISELCEKLLGQRMATASFGIKLEVDGEIVMHWIINRGTIVDTTKTRRHDGIAGHLSLSIRQLLHHEATYKIQVFMWDGRRLPESSSPDGPNVRPLTTIPINKRNFSWQLKRLLEAKLDDHNEAAGEALIDTVINLSIEDSGRLYFEARHANLSMGKGELRYDSTKQIS